MQLSTTIRRIGTIAALAGLPVTAALGAGTANASMQTSLGGSAAVTGYSAAPPKAVQARPAVPKGTTAEGAVSGSTAITGQIVLKPRDESGLKAFIANTSNKKSPAYRHYLSKGAFATDFGPSAATLNATEAALKAGGLTVKSVAADHMFVTFSGTATKVEKTFGTGLAKYRLASGRIGTATTSSVKLPASLAPQVTGVLGLDSLVSENPMGIHRGSNAKSHVAATKATFTPPTGSATSCANSTAAATDVGGLSDDQVAHAYGADGLYSNGDFGAGQNIAVFELEPFDAADLTTFDTCYFGATKAATMGANVNLTNVDGGQPAGPGSGESILDIEDVSAIAPDATIHVYDAPNSTFGAIDEYSTIINNDADQELTTSWGECEQTIQQGAPGQQQAENQLFMQAAAQGMSVFSAAGDEGSDDCNLFETDTPVSPVLSVDDPSSQPYVVAVGGTTMDNASQPADEHVWNDGSEWGAGGGGISESWTMPAWQLESTVPGIDPSSTVTDAISYEQRDLGDPSYAFCGSDTVGGQSGQPCRELPDVSANSDEFTGAITIYSASFGDNEADRWITIGGTSSAAPLWAGMLALVNASSTSPSCTPGTGTGVGFVNPLLYSVASDPAHYAESFNDITTGNNDPYGASNEFPTSAGYDMASGLGTPQLTGPGGTTGLAFNLCTLGDDPTRPTVSGITPSVYDQGSTGTVTIAGTNFGADLTVTVGSVVVPAVSISSITPTSITFQPPPTSAFLSAANDSGDGSGTYQVTVTSQGVTSAPGAHSMLDYVNADSSDDALPTVTSVSSYGGPDTGNNTVTIHGSGFTGATEVDFGGDAATYTVVNDNKITATVPAYNPVSTSCVETGALPGETATNDVCQAQVQVQNTHGASALSTIEPLFEGDFVLSPIDAVKVPNGQEAAPANTEYDYFPKPTITTVSTQSADAASLASEGGGTVVTITGSGLNDAGLSEVLIGDPTKATSEDSNYTFISGTKIQIQAPADDPADTANIAGLELQINGLGGDSSPSNVLYAGTPTVSGVTATSGPSTGKNGAVDSGGTPVSFTGTGLDSTDLVTFTDVSGPPSPGIPPFSVGTQYNLTSSGSTSLTTTTVSQNPAQVDAQACSVTGCSTTSAHDNFFLYPPGDPTASAASPTSGPSGTPVAITGTNLGCASLVTFGTIPTQAFNNAEAILDCGQTGEVDVIAPPLPAGTRLPKTVSVTVSTVESDLTGATPATTATFKYVAAKPAFKTKAPKPPTTAKVGTAYGPYTFSVSGTPSPTVKVSAGSLPPGVKLSSAGVLSGKPTAGGKFTFSVKATNATGSATAGPFTISVTGAPKFTKDSPGGGKVGTSYTYTFVASGGPKPTYKISSGKLPSGLKLSSGGVLSGKPAKAGTYHFKVTASNGQKPNAVTPNRTVTIKKK